MSVNDCLRSMPEAGKTSSIKKFFAWVCLFLAVAAVLTTPNAVVDAVRLVHSDRKLALVVPIAFAIRFAMIWRFIKGCTQIAYGASSDKAT
jgi:hypothetical protein